MHDTGIPRGYGMTKSNKERKKVEDDWFGFDFSKYVSDWKSVAFFIMLGLVFLLAPQLIRLADNNPSLVGGTPYLDMRIAELISEKGVVFEDNMVEGGRAFLPDPYQGLLSLLGRFLPLDLVSRIMPMFFGLISLLLIYLVLEKLNVDNVVKTTVIMITVLSPIFIYTFLIASKYTLIITLMLAGLYFYVSEGRLNLFISVLLFIPLAFFGLFESFLVVCIVLTHTLITKEKRGWSIAIAAMILLLGLSLSIYTDNTLPDTVHLSSTEGNILKGTISDFGSLAGVGIFTLLLSIVGIVFIWRKSREDAWLIVLMLTLILAVVIFNSMYIIYAGFLIGYFAAIGFSSIMRRGWHIETLKYLTAVTLVSGLLFSTVSYISAIGNSEPDAAQSASMIWMKELPAGTVLTHHSNGFWIEGMADKSVVMDAYMLHDPEINSRYEYTQAVFASRNLEKTISMLREKNVRYIWIDSQMKNGEVWTRDEDGMLFLLKNNETFKKIYSNSEVEIYKVLDGVQD